MLWLLGSLFIDNFGLLCFFLHGNVLMFFYNGKNEKF